MFLRLCLAALLTGAVTSSAIAAEPVAAPAEPPTASAAKAAPPAGVRMVIDGNSWSVWPQLLLPLAKDAGIQGQMDCTKEAQQRIEKGEIDAWTYGTHQPIDGYAAKTVELGVKHNPDFRLFYQASWPIGDARWINKGDEIKTLEDYDATKIDHLQKYTDEIRKAREGFADGINTKLGKRAVVVVPFGDAIVKLRAMIVDGKFPGVKRQSELFPDTMPHPGPLLAWLSAYCHFSAIYRIPPPAASPPAENADQAAKESHAQHAILRRIAWETVSEYPYAGIKQVALPRGAGETPAVPTTTEAVPAGLEGWKPMTALPQKAVITDYNAYIEALPQAERMGVADVRYFTDGAGQIAVAIMEKGKDGPRMHVLVYDPQNKRLGVSKNAVGPGK